MCFKHNYKAEKGIIYCTNCGKHKHVYTVFEEISVYHDNSSVPNHYEYILRCKICGKMKKKRG